MNEQRRPAVESKGLISECSTEEVTAWGSSARPQCLTRRSVVVPGACSLTARECQSVCAVTPPTALIRRDLVSDRV